MLPYCRHQRAWLSLASALLLAGCGEDPTPVSTTQTPPPASTRATIDPSPAVGDTLRAFGASHITRTNRAPGEPSPRATPGRIELLDPTASPSPVEIGEPLDVDELPWDAPTDPVDLGDPLDADREADDSLAVDGSTEPVDLGEPLDAEDPQAIPDMPLGEPTDLGEWRDASVPEDDPTPATDPIDLGPPLNVPGTPLFD